jgi:hypothetical protein
MIDLGVSLPCPTVMRDIIRASGTAAYFHTDLPFVAVNKDAFPTAPARIAGRIKSFRLPKQAQVLSVIYQS